MVKSPAEFIREKGARTIADAIDQKAGTVRMWRNRDRIPRRVWPELQKAFDGLTVDDLMQIEAAGK